MARRILPVAVGAALALAAVAPVQASPLPAPAAGAVVDEAALASWTFPTGRPGRARWIFAGALRDQTAGGRTQTFAFVVKGTCRAGTGKHRHATECRGRGTGGVVPDGRFHVDPALGSARLVLRDRGRIAHEIAWRAQQDTVPYGYLAGEACPAGNGEGAGMQRAALAGGRLFGRKVSRDATDHAMVARGAMVTECGETIPLRVLRRAAAGERVRLVFPGR